MKKEWIVKLTLDNADRYKLDVQRIQDCLTAYHYEGFQVHEISQSCGEELALYKEFAKALKEYKYPTLSGEVIMELQRLEDKLSPKPTTCPTCKQECKTPESLYSLNRGEGQAIGKGEVKPVDVSKIEVGDEVQVKFDKLLGKWLVVDSIEGTFSIHTVDTGWWSPDYITAHRPKEAEHKHDYHYSDGKMVCSDIKCNHVLQPLIKVKPKEAEEWVCGKSPCKDCNVAKPHILGTVPLNVCYKPVKFKNEQ